MKTPGDGLYTMTTDQSPMRDPEVITPNPEAENKVAEFEVGSADNYLLDQEEIKVDQMIQDQVIFEFSVTGMTCVACSGSIERLIHNEFDKKSLISVSIVLLTNKMFCTFDAHVFKDKEVTPEMVCEEVDGIGFECGLISITEMKGEE